MTPAAFAANTVCIGNNLVMPGCGRKLRAELESRGYKVVTVPLGSFQRSGGGGVLPDLAARPAISQRPRSRFFRSAQRRVDLSSAGEPGQSSFSLSALSGAATV